MKKNIIYILGFFLTLILSSCGSNSIVDRGLNDFLNLDLVELTPTSLQVNNRKFSTTIPFVKLENQDITIKYTNLDLSINGCEIEEGASITPSPFILDGAKGSQKFLNISGEVKNDCTPLGYVITADKELLAAGQTNQTTNVSLLVANLDSSGNPIINDGNTTIVLPDGTVVDTNVTDPEVEAARKLEFFNVTSSVVINKADTTFPIQLQLIDELKKGASGQTLDILAFDSTFGTVVSMKATTDSNGFATFTYTSPSDLSTLNGKTLPLSIVFDVNGERIKSTNVTLTFNASSITPNSFIFKNATNIVVKEAGETQNITIDLVDGDGVGVEGKTIKATSLPLVFGGLTSSVATTNSAGRATFTYTAPETLNSIDGNTTTLQLQFTDDNDNTLFATINIKIDLDVVLGVRNGSNNIEITANNQQKTIGLYVVDTKRNIGVEGKEVSISTVSKGTISASKVLTNSAGRAEFTYTAPDNIENLNSITVALRFFDNGIEYRHNLNISFIPPSQSTPTYTLTNQNDINITFENETKEIAIQLLEDGRSQVGKTVISKFLSSTFGFIQNTEVQTGSDGYARFTYQAPANLIDGTVKLELVFVDGDGVEQATQSININVKKSIPTVDRKITNLTNQIVVNFPDEEKEISLYVVDSTSGVGVSGEIVSITAIKDSKFGSIILNSQATTDASGKAVFNYKAPSDISSIDGNSTTITVSLLNNSITITQDINISFVKVADPAVKLPIIVISDAYNNIKLTDNRQNVEIEVQVFEENTNAPFTTGNVRVSLPASVLTGEDVGSFTTYSVPIASNGIATFNYNGPSDLKTLKESGVNGSSFEFFHEDNPTEKKIVTTRYELVSSYIPSEYTLSTSSSDGNNTMGLESLKTFTLYLKDDKGTLVSDENIHSIKLKSNNIVVGKIINADNGTEQSNVTISDQNATNNSKSFSLQSYRLSGLLPIEIEVVFRDANDLNQTVTQLMNVVVFSGPPTAMSIVYAGVEQDQTTAKYIEKFVLTVTDAYNNPVNTQPYVAAGAMVEYAVDGSSATGIRGEISPRLWHGTSDTLADLTHIATDEAELNTSIATFQHLDLDNDKLVTFGAGFIYDALGKWDILSKSEKKIELEDAYFGKSRQNLLFAVGHNNRQDLCSNDGTEYIGNLRNSNFQLDTTGHAKMDFEYDYHLTGKDIMVWANLEGFQADNNRTGRVGEAKKHTLRGNGLVFVPNDGYTLDKGSSAIVTFVLRHENAPEPYINGHFAYSIKSGSTCFSRRLISSNDFDARRCDSLRHVTLELDNNSSNPLDVDQTLGSGSNQAYITYYISSAADKGCTFALDDILMVPEFSSSVYPERTNFDN